MRKGSPKGGKKIYRRKVKKKARKIAVKYTSVSNVKKKKKKSFTIRTSVLRRKDQNPKLPRVKEMNLLDTDKRQKYSQWK